MSLQKISVGEDGVALFWCEGCKTHHQVHVHPHTQCVWGFNGDLVNPTLTPSVKVTFGKNGSKVCHSYVTDGRIRYLPDSTHELAGKTVDMKPIMEGGAT